MLAGVTLIVECGPQSGAEFRLPIPSACIVGRSSDCDIALVGNPDPCIMSRHHCCLEVRPNGVHICDLGSRNGTFVNGELLGQRFCQSAPDHDWWTSEGQLIADGDAISLGGVTLRVSLQAEAPECVPVSERPTINALCLFPTGAMSW